MENTESEKDKQNPNDIVNQLLKYYNEKTNIEEDSALQQWRDQNEENSLFLKKITNEHDLQEELQIFKSLDLDAAWQKVAAKTTNPKKSFAFWYNHNALKYAASVMLVAALTAIGYVLKNKDLNHNGQIAQKTLLIQHPILPFQNKTILTFADGSVVILEDLKNGVITKREGIKVIKTKEQITFQLDNTVAIGVGGMNKISTQSGAQYKIVLADGSKVWLNAASTLSFPSAFTKNERVVALTGEGYFEIAKNKLKPFTVHSNNTTVTVLGTHFNIMSYPEENTTNTTLLEGSVQVRAGSMSKMLLPGQQAAVKDGIQITEADLDEAIAWKNGNFQFNNTELGMIMRQMERWYGVEVDMKGNVAEKHFTGIIPRNIPVAKVLKMLELSGDIHFKIKERRIIVSPNAG